MRRPFLLAFFAYLIPTFATGFFWHMVVFGDVYRELNVYRENPLVPLGFTSMLIQGILFAWAFPRLFNTRRDAWRHSAFASGVLFALLSWSFTTVAAAAKYPMASVEQFVAIESGYTVLQFLLVAPLMALVWRDPAAA